jgi:DNA repair protein RadC
MIVCHNHPSGTCDPSEDDIETTQTLIAASQIIGITLLDHIILDRDSYFSFLEHNLLFTETE